MAIYDTAPIGKRLWDVGLMALYVKRLLEYPVKPLIKTIAKRVNVAIYIDIKARLCGNRSTDQRCFLCLLLILVEMRVLFLYSQHSIRISSRVRALCKRSLI